VEEDKIPIYSYECDSCKVNFERHQQFKDSPLKRCPECKRHKLRRLLNIPHINIIKEITTLGQHVDRKTRKMGKYELDKIEREDKLSRRIEQEEARPWWRKGPMNKQLTTLNNDQKRNYVLDNKLPISKKRKKKNEK